MFKHFVLAVAAISAAAFAAPASAQVTYTLVGFSDVIDGPQSFSVTLDTYLTADRIVPASAFTSCLSASPCVGFEFYLVDPFNGISDYSLLNFQDESSGTFYYFQTADFAANGVYTNPEIGFNLATLTVSGAPVAAVPEPAAWGMLIGGFGFAGAAMRRRRVAVRFA